MADAPAGLSALQFNILTVCGAAALLLVAANVGLSLNNRQAQAEVNSRQQYINQTVQLSRLNNEIVQALANLSVQTNDDSIRTLLAEHGIQINTGAGAAPGEEGTGDE